ncbi:MAG TPA: DUF3857 domain-containing protein [Bacteroidales bacterium]|nr:DUF3857 domain-containing protein [Bacteroidales bacterium]
MFPFHLVHADDPNCEVLKFVSRSQVSNNRLSQTDSIIIQINNRSGEKYCEITLNSGKSNPVTNLTAWIEDANGNVIRYLKNKEITESNYYSSMFYTDDYDLKFVLKHNEYPYRICYTYQKSFREFYSIRSWCPVLGLEVPTHTAVLNVSVPEDYKLSILQNDIDPPSISSANGMITRSWNASYDGHYRDEMYSPHPFTFLPVVRIIPVNFRYVTDGSMDSWDSFGKWQCRLIKGLDVLPPEEVARLKVQMGDIKEPDQIISYLYHYMQDNTHYVNVDIGVGGLVPYPASYVVQNKYGDCKALTIYMKALLKAFGIESYYMLVNAGTTITPVFNTTPFQQFNHVILAVPLQSDTMWLENTSASLPCGYLGSFTHNRYGLLVDENESHLISTPALKPEDVRNSSRINFFLNPGDRTTVSYYSEIKGPAFETYCSLIRDYNSNDQNRIIHRLMPFNDFDLIKWQVMRKGRDASTISLMASVTIPDQTHAVGQEFYFSYLPLEIESFESPRIRKLPLQLPYPVSRFDTLVYYIPQGKKVTSFPADKEIRNKFGYYKTSFVNDGNSLVLYREFELYPIEVSIQEYNDFYNFISTVRSEEKQKILFQ